MIKAWLRKWLSMPPLTLVDDLEDIHKVVRILQTQVQELRSEVTRLSIAQYVPPKQPEPERKIIKTRNFKEYLDILEQEQSQETT
jgi:hypothetical protein